MVRPPLSGNDRDRGTRLGALLRRARGSRTMGEVAESAGVSVDTLRKIETGRIPTPAFFTVATVAYALGLSLDQVADTVSDPDEPLPTAYLVRDASG